ncbi:hypothetical protein Vadar_026201 [Vaccinium darrowii]|uniref:Uncharacterized protein n=1 Tax=Vaccinium darrowii TaxID=229202 RepID=A0ACB7XUN3_9ERIC|nr:hypothetical protein Vadar_026201 [Vaccinium darrowii]
MCISNAYVSAGGDRRRREEDFAKFVKSQDKEMKEFMSKRDKLVKTYKDKRKTALRRFSKRSGRSIGHERGGSHLLSIAVAVASVTNSRDYLPDEQQITIGYTLLWDLYTMGIRPSHDVPSPSVTNSRDYPSDELELLETDLLEGSPYTAICQNQVALSIINRVVLGREPLRSEVVEKKQDTTNQTRSLRAMMENIRVYLMTQILTIKNREYNRITLAHQYGGQDVYSHPQNTQFNKEGKGEKMIQAVLQEEIGGKVGSFAHFNCSRKTDSNRINLR